MDEQKQAAWEAWKSDYLGFFTRYTVDTGDYDVPEEGEEAFNAAYDAGRASRDNEIRLEIAQGSAETPTA